MADSVLKALSDAARSVALTLLMHRAENRAASNVRLKRCEHLIKALDEQIAAVPNGGVVAAQVKAAGGELFTIDLDFLRKENKKPVGPKEGLKEHLGLEIAPESWSVPHQPLSSRPKPPEGGGSPPAGKPPKGGPPAPPPPPAAPAPPCKSLANVLASSTSSRAWTS